jgi:hypothetical protein
MNLTPTGWLDDLLPEMLWIALLNSRFGFKRGAELAVGLAKAAASCTSGAKGAFAFISEYGQLKPTEQDCVKMQLTNSGTLSQLNEALLVFAD